MRTRNETPTILLVAACLLISTFASADESGVPAASAGGSSMFQVAQSDADEGDAPGGELDVPTLVAVAYKLLEGGDDVGAEEAFSAALRLEPDNPDAREGLVWIYVRRGDFERAAELADMRLALDPDGSWHDQWLSVIRLAPSRRAEAIAVFREQIAAHSTDLESHLRLAELLVWSSSFAEAIEVYRDAAKIEPENLEVQLGLAAALSYAGERAESDAIFDTILQDNPHNVEALLGRARSARWQGDWDTARQLLDRALLVSAADQALIVERVQLEIDPALLTAETAAASVGSYWRDEAIEQYRQQAAADPMALEPRLRLAELLSWVPAQRAESVAVYREALDIDPTNVEARLGLAAVLSWQGDRDEANDLFEAVLDEQPNNVEALLGRARSARWEGDWSTARDLFDRALIVSPVDVSLVTERAQLELDPALQNAEIAVAESVSGPRQGPPERRAEVGFYPTMSQDSESFTRLSVRAAGQTFPWDDTRVRLLAAWTRFADDVDSLDRISLGGALRQYLPLEFYLRALLVAHLYNDAPNVTEWDVEGGLANPDWPVQFRLGFWQHAIVDEIRTYDQIAYLEGVGSGGMSVAAMRNDVQVRDAYLAATGSPVAGPYLYGVGTFGMVSDDNQRLTAGAGLGFDVLYYTRVDSAHELFVKYDLFYLSYADPRPDYWSPGSFLVHTPGLGWNWHVAQRWTVGAEAGAPIDPSDGSIGYLVGAFCRFTFVDHWYLQARVRAVDDTEYAVYAGTIGVGYMF